MSDETKTQNRGEPVPGPKSRPLPNIPKGKPQKKKKDGGEYLVTPMTNDVTKETRVDVDPRFQVARRRRR